MATVTGLPYRRGEVYEKKYNAIQVFTSAKDTVHNLMYSCAHVPAQ